MGPVVNKLSISGIVASRPKLTETINGDHVLSFHLESPRPSAPSLPPYTFLVVTYSRSAEDAYRRIKKGDAVLIRGTLNLTDGKHKAKCYIHALSIEVKYRNGAPVKENVP